MTNPQLFQIGQEVEIIGISRSGCNDYRGQRFVVSQYHCDETSERCSTTCFPWYPASSLRLVQEELKIGDWVEITGKPDGYPQNWDNEGKIDQVREIKSEGRFWLDKACLLYRTNSIRKLTPEEVAMHTGTLGYKIRECEKSLAEAREKLGMPPQNQFNEKVEARLSAIEKQLAEDARFQATVNCEVKARLIEDRNLMTEIEERMDGRVDEIEEDLGKIFKQLAFVEAYQRGEMSEVCDVSRRLLQDGKPIMPAWCERLLDSMMNEECCK